MTKDEDLEIVVMPQVLEAIAGDPELAEMLREFLANAHQAHEAVRSGRYETFQDAIEAITGFELKVLEDEDDVA